MSNTTWPVGADLVAWVGADALSTGAVDVADELVEDATSITLDSIDTDKLPVAVDEQDVNTCPRAVRRAIILEAARLLTRRDSANGVIGSGELLIRVSGVDADVTRLLRPYRLEAEA